MQKSRIVLAVLTAFAGAGAGAGLTACGDDTVMPAASDAGGDGTVATFDGYAPFEAGTFVDNAAPPEGGGETGPGADAAPPPRMLLTYNGASQSELVAFGLASSSVDGRLVYDDFIGTAYVGGGAPWLLEQSTDLVGRLDVQKPWVVDSSWSVAMHDLTDAGYAQSYADPQAAILAGSKAYVLRYTRNLVAVLDPSQSLDGGAPTGSVDLSGEIQASGDGYVQPLGGVYVAAQKRVYVVLGNIDRFDVVNNGYDLLCTSTTPTVVAIDTTSDTLVDLNGSAPGSGWALPGYNPAQGLGVLAYDAQTGSSGRLLVIEAGCYQPTGDGGAGPLVKRQVDSIDLATGQTQVLLDLTTAAFPFGLTYIDAHHAIVQLDTAYAWDPTTTTLGPAIPNAPDAFVYDGAGNLVGVKTNYAADGGVQGIDVLSVSVDGGVTKLASNPFTLTGGFIGGVALWPVP
jgi:hypothetical protein